jgi:hypothetical protein
MASVFVLDDQTHVGADRQCPACASDYPQPCRCGGLMHGASADAVAEGSETTGAIEGAGAAVSTRCDVCGRSEDDQAEEEGA